MKFLLFLLIAIYLIVPVLLFKLNNRRVAQFCVFMTTSEQCRKFYCYTLLLAVIYFHFVYYQSYRTEYFLMVSSIAIIVMFCTRLVERLLTALSDDTRRLYAFSITVVAIAFIPHMLTTAMTGAMILVGACFYPSRRIRECDEYFLTGYYNQCVRSGDYRDILNAYFA